MQETSAVSREEIYESNDTLALTFHSTGHRDYSTYTLAKCVHMYGGFIRTLHARNARVKFYTSFYTHLNYETFRYSYTQTNNNNNNNNNKSLFHKIKTHILCYKN